MTVQTTIIGTGQIGASIGLALREHIDLFFRVGHDKDFRVANRSKEMGAFDRVERNLPSSVDGAQIVILALPLDQIPETLKFIAEALQDDAVVMDTSPVKSQVLSWMNELLPPKCHYIGLVPVLNPAYLDSSQHGVEAAHADLFKKGTIAILSPQGASSEAIKLATDFTHLLGAAHLYIDPIELDSMMAATHVLPQLIGTAYLNSTVDQPGWADARKLAGQPYAQVTGVVRHSQDAHTLASEALSVREHLMRQIDALVSDLNMLRDQLSSNDSENLLQEFSHARQGQEKWLTERNSSSWDLTGNASGVDLPTSKQIFTRMFTFGGGRKPKLPKSSKS